MQVNIKEYLDKCGVSEPLYPGKRFVKKLPQSGENKSHCVVYDWRDPTLLQMEIKAGLSGKNMEPKELKKFPVSFQSPTYIHIKTAVNDDDIEDDEDDEEGGKGKKGGGSKGQKKKKKKEPLKTLQAFTEVVDGKIPDLGEIKKLVVMGKEIAKNAMASVMECLAAQISNLSVAPVNLLTATTIATPGGGLDPKGHETTAYKYNAGGMFGLEDKPSP